MKLKLVLILALLAALFFMGCENIDPPTQNPVNDPQQQSLSKPWQDAVPFKDQWPISWDR